MHEESSSSRWKQAPPLVSIVWLRGLMVDDVQPCPASAIEYVYRTAQCLLQLSRQLLHVIRLVVCCRLLDRLCWTAACYVRVISISDC